MYKERCGFVCKDFPKENQQLAKKQLPFDLAKIAIIFIRCVCPAWASFYLPKGK